MLRLLAAAGLLVGSTPLLAQAADPAAARAGDRNDPGRVICEKIPVPGSRIASKKVCMTRQQWEEQRQQNRDDLQRFQQSVSGPRSG